MHHRIGVPAIENPHEKGIGALTFGQPEYPWTAMNGARTDTSHSNWAPARALRKFWRLVSGPEIDLYSDAAEGDRMGETGNLKYGTERRCPA